MAKVIVYSKEYCSFCVQAKELLKSKGVQYTEIMVDKNPVELQNMLKLSNGRKTVPQIFIDDYHVGGCDDLKSLNNKGELDKLLNLKTGNIT